jgi:hypothetical protein
MKFTTKDDGFWSGCVGLGVFVFYGVWLGQEACVALGKVLERIGVQLPCI